MRLSAELSQAAYDWIREHSFYSTEPGTFGSPVRVLDHLCDIIHSVLPGFSEAVIDR